MREAADGFSHHARAEAALTGACSNRSAAILTGLIADELLDYENYISVNSFCDPVPEFGLRFCRGKECLDILMSCEPSSHLHIWAFLRDENDNITYGSDSYTCIFNEHLRGLAKGVTPE